MTADDIFQLDPMHVEIPLNKSYRKKITFNLQLLP